MKYHKSLFLISAVLCACAVLPSLAMSGLPAGLDMTMLSDMGEVLSKCNGDFGDLVSLYMVEGSPLINVVKTEIGKSNEDKEDDVELSDAIISIMASDEFDALLNSSTLQRISDTLNLTCTMEDPRFIKIFKGVLISQNITEETSDLYPILKDVPALVGGFYSCGGRIVNLMQFAKSAVPDIVSDGGFDPMAILNTPSFSDLTNSGFDMSCFFGIPAVGGLVATAMG